MDNLLLGALDNNGLAETMHFRIKDNKLVITDMDDETLAIFYKEEINDIIKLLEMSKKYLK